jgi:hypothetical protein
VFDCVQAFLEGFARLDIVVLVIKGPALSARCYGNAGMRQYGDLDLIVSDKDIARTVEAMHELGYELRIPLRAIQAAKIPGEYVFMSRDKKLFVEFHTERNPSISSRAAQSRATPPTMRLRQRRWPRRPSALA